MSTDESITLVEYYEQTIQIQKREISELKDEIKELNMEISELRNEIECYKSDAADARAEANWNERN